jgi:TonB family protein
MNGIYKQNIMLKGWEVPLFCSLLLHLFLFLLVAFSISIAPAVSEKVYTIDFLRIKNTSEHSHSNKNTLGGPLPSVSIKPENPNAVAFIDKAIVDNTIDNGKSATDSAVGGFDIGDLDEVPKILTMIKPDYPEKLRQEGIEGKVVLKFLIHFTGSVREVVILEPSPYEAFNDASVKAVKKWNFSPPIINGKPVSAWFKVPIRFKLKDEE